MIGQATAHRRANAFAQALEDAAVLDETTGERGGGGAGPASGQHGSHAAARHADPEQDSLLSLAAAIGDRPAPVLDAEKKTVQRAQLIAAMEQAIADGSFEVTGRVPEQRSEGTGGHGAHRLRKLTPRSRLSRRLAVGGLSVGVAAGAFGGVAAASTNALPGDTLYGLKRGMEDLKLDMAGSDASRGKVYLDMASTRMQEARRLMDRQRGGQLDDESVGDVRKALSGMRQEAAEGHRLLTQAYAKDGSLQPMALLNTFAASHRQSWTEMRGKLPSQLTDVSDQVSSVFAAIDDDVKPLESVLPKPKDDSSSGSRGHRRSGGGSDDGTGSGTGSGSGTPSAPASGDSKSGQAPSGNPSASPTTPQHEGLIGGPLLPPPPNSTPGSGNGATDTPSTSATPPHSVTLPPLLPGLLPGLGLGVDDSND
ncbi:MULTISPECIES: DUF5667 domain-containing protein [unclassified Streptomyces]|uniref:DUF5667 domain-containing protein n=1 Tax=unclassified Streptomyces TaxID=2593676 RepID=UPI0036E75B0F